MSVRLKSRRRHFFLLIPTLSVVFVVGGVSGVRLIQLRNAAFRCRTDGLRAATEGDYSSALAQLGKYVTRYPDDAEATYRYAQARKNVEEPNGEHIAPAIALYQRTLELQPNNIDAQKDLLDLYSKVGFDTEVIALSAQITASRAGGALPVDPHVLYCRALALTRLQRYREARECLDALIKSLPHDLEVRMLGLQIEFKTDGPDRVVADSRQLAAEHPNDVRFELLQSSAATFAGDRESATKLVRPLVDGPLPDSSYVRLLVRQLDELKLLDESLSVLQRATQSGADPEIKRLWYRRLFEMDQYAALIVLTADLDPNLPHTDLEAIAIRVCALWEFNRNDEANRFVADLEKRGESDRAAATWAAMLRAIAARKLSEPTKAVGVLRSAIVANPGNLVLGHMLGSLSQAQAWLDRVSLVSAEGPLERMTQANAWLAMGKRWGNRSFVRMGSDILAALASPADAHLEIVLSNGMACESASDWKGAEKAYRRVMARDPNNSIALNNLASVLVKTHGDLDEAESLISRDLSLHPNTPDFLDTMASIEAARGNFSRAIAILQEAQQREPWNFEWRLNLLQFIIDSGDTEAARNEIRKIRASMPDFAEISPDMRHRYDELSSRLQ